MKTTIYFTALAVLARVAAIAQINSTTPVSNALLPVTKHQSSKVVSLSAAQPVSDKTALQIAAFENRIEEINKQISELEGLKSQVHEEINDFFVQQPSLVSPDALYIKAFSEEELMQCFLKQADDLYKQSAGFRAQALTQSGSFREQSLNSAIQFEAAAIAKQIEASVLSGKISLEKFNENSSQIDLFLRTFFGSQSKLEKAGDMAFEANRSMRMAIEMREEANTYENASARLGAMQNAEEKEFTALSQQNKVLNMFGATLCSN